ncbi:MAG: hypothetical protein AB7V22_06660 [Kiritimatiellia bacterium]
MFDRFPFGGRRRGRWKSVCSLPLLWVVGAFAQEAPPRVALLATTLNADSEKYLDVATAELSARGDLELVERQAIRQVLGEQALALQQDASGVAAGQLLRADVVGVLETTPDGKEAGGFAVLDTATGVSYWNAGLDQTDVEGVAGEMARGVAAALEKRNRTGALGTVCVLGARNAEFPRNLDVFCETVAYLLERRLVANPALATLDRRRLEAVVSENALPGVESKSAALRASLRLVELDFRRGAADGEMKVLVRTTDAGGTLIAQPEVAGPQDAAALADRLQAALAEVLHAAPQAAAGDRAQEANRFRAQGKILWDRDLHEAGMRAYEAAYALDPGADKQIGEYVDRLLHRAYDHSLAGRVAETLEYVGRALDVEDRHGVRRKYMAEFGRDYVLSALVRCKPGLAADASQAAAYDGLRRRYLATVGLTDAAGTPSAATLNAESATRSNVGGIPVYYADSFSPQLRFPVLAALALSRDADEFFRLLDIRLVPWLAREADPAQPHDAGIITTIDNLCGTELRHVWQSRGYVPFDAAYVQGLRALAARFRAHPRKVVQLEGAYLERRIDLEVALRSGSAEDPEVLSPRVAELIDMALGIVAPPASLPAGDEAVVYEMAARAAKLLDHPNRNTTKNGRSCGELRRIAETMIDFGRLSGPVLATLLDSEADFETYRLPVLRRLKTAHAAGTHVWLSVNRKEVDEYLKALPVEREAAASGSVAAQLWDLPARDAFQFRQVGLCVQNEDTWYVFAGQEPGASRNDGAAVDVLRIDVGSGRAIPLARIQPRTCWVSQYVNARAARGCEGDFIEGAVPAGGRLWIATSGDGLYGVSLDGVGEPAHIGMAEGLPSDVIHSVAAVGDRLYFGCGQLGTEGYLAAYDLTSGRSEVLASTLRASPETPLDSLVGGFRIRGIAPDAPRNRLLLVVDHGDLQPATGLWEFRLDQNTFRQIRQMDRPAHSANVGADGKLWIYPLCRNAYRPIREKDGWYGAVEFDPETDEARLVFASKNKGAGPELPVRADTRIFPALHHAGVLVAEGWLYHFASVVVNGTEGLELRRVSLATREIQALDAGLFRGNVYYLGRIHWLPDQKVLLVGDGGRLAAFVVGP